ncbi:ester cyclase [Flindersiella endophytica]
MSTTVPASSTSTARAVMQQMLDGFAAGDTTVVDRLCAPDLVEHQFGMAGAGAEAVAHVRAAIQDLHRAIPDLSITIEDAIETGDTIWVRARARGTATGPFFGPPTGRPIDVTVFDVARIVDGRMVEHWGVPDRFAVLAQTGVLERLGGTPARDDAPAGSAAG